MQESMGLDDPVPGTKRSPGRPTKKTRAVTDRLFAAIEKGMPYSMACELSGISEAVFYQWRQDPAFDAQVTRRTAESVFELLDTIKEARHQNWQAAAFLLERRWPKHYGRAEAQLNFEVAVTNNNQTVNHLVIAAEVADQIQSRTERAAATVEKLFAAKTAATGTKGDDIREVETLMVSALAITMPPGEPPSSWWTQLAQGSNDRPITEEAAVFVCQTLLRESGGLAAQSTRIDFETDPVTLRDLHAAIQDRMGPPGWAALLKKGDSK
jgi:transposase